MHKLTLTFTFCTYETFIMRIKTQNILQNGIISESAMHLQLAGRSRVIINLVSNGAICNTLKIHLESPSEHYIFEI